MKVKRNFFDEFNGVPPTTQTITMRVRVCVRVLIDIYLFILISFFYRIDVNINRSHSSFFLCYNFQFLIVYRFVSKWLSRSYEIKGKWNLKC